MVLTESTQSLNLIKEQLDESLRQAEHCIEQFVEDENNTAPLVTCQETLQQLTGVLKLIELRSACQFSSELTDLSGAIIAGTVKEREQALGTLSGAIMILGKYFEHAHRLQKSVPILLVPVINEVRSLLRRPFVSESDYASLSMGDRRPSLGHGPDHLALQTSGRRLRHMFQTGLLGLFRDENPALNARIMERALERLQVLSGDTPLTLLWWLGLATLESVASGALSLNTARKSMLGALDRQLKAAVTQGEHVFERTPPDALVMDLLMCVVLSAPPGSRVKDVRECYGFEDSPFDDAWLVGQREAMFGPGGEVMRSVVMAIHEEIAGLKEQLDLGARGAQEDEEGRERVTESLYRIGNTLSMLGLAEASAAVKSCIPGFSRRAAGTASADSPEFTALADALLFVESAVATLLPQTTVGSGQPFRGADSHVSVNQLDEARRLVVAEARSGFSLVKRAIASFIESNWDEMHLANVPTTLNGIWGGLVFLKMDRAAEIVRSCEAFLSAKLVRPHSQPPPASILDTFADAITSVDYFLESIEQNKPIGEGILDVAEESLQELGFPVKTA